jgi:ribosomal protein S18 acetylase RimI-like enzyme
MRNSHHLRERMRFATAPGGVGATAWWLLKLATRFETHHVFGHGLRPTTNHSGAACPKLDFRSVRSLGAANDLDAKLRDQLEEHLSKNLGGICSRGGGVYFLTDAGNVVSQLTIDIGPLIRVDVPAGLVMDIGATRAFLSYLHTEEPYRRTGAARNLMQFVADELRKDGVEQLVSHVRTTNVPSLNAFRRSGWMELGTIWTRTSGSLLLSPGLARHDIRAFIEGRRP